MKEKIVLTLFISIFAISTIQIFMAHSLLVTGFNLFVAGASGAIVLGAFIKYFSQEEIDLRDIKREKALIRRSIEKKGKYGITRTTKVCAKKVAARK
jgi:hypothetical protein